MLLKSLTVITETDGNTVKMPAVKNDFTFLIDDVFNAYPHAPANQLAWLLLTESQ